MAFLDKVVIHTSMYIMSKRDDILVATKQLFWERGYEATSPRDIQEVSGAGQGSFYHHFRSKRDLACEAISEVVADRIAEFERDMSGPGTLRERLDRFLVQPRESLKGCRIGRMVWDSAIDDPRLREPLARYFRHIEDRLGAELNAALERGELELKVPAEQIVLMVLSALQGGFTISRATQQRRVDEVVSALGGMLDVVMIIC